jgi:hypothetical protein
MSTCCDHGPHYELLIPPTFRQVPPTEFIGMAFVVTAAGPALLTLALTGGLPRGLFFTLALP